MTESTRTPKHAGGPKHVAAELPKARPWGRRARREAERKQESADRMVRLIAGGTVNNDHTTEPKMPTRHGRSVALKLRISDLEKSKAYIDGEIRLLRHELDAERAEEQGK